MDKKMVIPVAPKTYVSSSAQLRKGTFVEPMAVVKVNNPVAGCIILAVSDKGTKPDNEVNLAGEW